jgi:hypothetical protein
MRSVGVMAALGVWGPGPSPAHQGFVVMGRAGSAVTECPRPEPLGNRGLRTCRSFQDIPVPSRTPTVRTIPSVISVPDRTPMIGPPDRSQGSGHPTYREVGTPAPSGRRRRSCLTRGARRPRDAQQFLPAWTTPVERIPHNNKYHHPSCNGPVGPKKHDMSTIIATLALLFTIGKGVARPVLGHPNTDAPGHRSTAGWNAHPAQNKVTLVRHRRRVHPNHRDGPVGRRARSSSSEP